MDYKINEMDTYGDLRALHVTSEAYDLNGRLWVDCKTKQIIKFYALNEEYTDYLSSPITTTYAVKIIREIEL